MPWIRKKLILFTDSSTNVYILEAGFCMCHIFRFVAKRCVLMSYKCFSQGMTQRTEQQKQAAISHLFRDWLKDTNIAWGGYLLFHTNFSFDLIHFPQCKYDSLQTFYCILDGPCMCCFCNCSLVLNITSKCGIDVLYSKEISDFHV